MIEVKNISKRYRNTVLDDISFTAEKGQCIGIIGANGCGKTTLLSIMYGWCQQDTVWKNILQQ